MEKRTSRPSVESIGAYSPYELDADGMPSIATDGLAESCLCLQMQSASRAIARHFDGALRPLGLTNWQFALLLALHRAPSVAIGDLADRLVMDRSTATANLKPLMRRGLVDSQPHPKDGRVRLVALTDNGRAVLADAAQLWAVAGKSVTHRLSRTDVRAVCRALRRISGINHSPGQSRRK